MKLRTLVIVLLFFIGFSFYCLYESGIDNTFTKIEERRHNNEMMLEDKQPDYQAYTEEKK